MADSNYISSSDESETTFSHGDNLVNDYSVKEINTLLNGNNQPEELAFHEKTLDEQKEQLHIEQNNYSKQEKYKIIMHLTKKYKLNLLLYIKEELCWDFDFYFYDFPYAITTISYCNTLEHLRFYFEVFKADYDYTIYDLEYSVQSQKIEPPKFDILYTAAINLLRYDFSMFEYLFNKVVENNPLRAIKGNSKLLYNIINCNNPDFICNIIDKYDLDIYYINPVIRVSVLFFAIKRCTLDTILYLNDKYECDIFKTVGGDYHLQEFIINYLFSFCNYKGVQCYIFPESERERIFEYIINYIGIRAITYAKRKLSEAKPYINYDVYMSIINKHQIKAELECINTTCTTCKTEIEKEDGSTFYMSKNNTYHNICCGELVQECLTKVYINNCAVCLDDAVNDYVVFYCGHMICINCIAEYKKHSSRCSYCRINLDTVGYIEF